jgi:hypothetical protein
MGNEVTWWNTSDHGIAKISSLDHVTAMGVGMVSIDGMIGNLAAASAAVDGDTGSEFCKPERQTDDTAF